MKRLILPILVACWGFGPLMVAAQHGLVNAISGWTAYMSHMYGQEITQHGDLIYVITKGGLYSYNPADASTVQYSTVEGLSGSDPTTIYSDSASGLLFVGYKSGMINYLDGEGQLHYVSDISRTTLFTTKGINRMVSADGLLYIATEFGIVVYDVARHETKLSVTKVGTNPTGAVVNSLCLADGRLWAAMGTRGIWSVDLSAPNIALPDAWSVASGANGLPTTGGERLCVSEGKVYALITDTIFQRELNGTWIDSPFGIANFNSLNANDGRVFATFTPSRVAILQPSGQVDTVDRYGTVTCAWVTGDVVYVGDASVGMSRNYPGGNFGGVAPLGPRNNFVTELAAGNGGLYIAPRGKKGASDRYFDKSGIPFFGLHHGGWHLNDHRSGDLVQGEVWQDFARACFDPHTGHCFVGSWGEGIVELDTGRVMATYTSTNSGLTWSSTGHRVSGLAVDDVGNLWITQALGDYTLNCKTPDGQWYAFNPMNGIVPVGIAVDDYGNKWILDQDEGLVIFNDNYTPGDPSDDRVRVFNSTYGQGGLPNNSVRTVIQDHDQQMWIGTTDGVTILYDPSILWTPEFQDAACPIIDGYCLLRGQTVYDIAVDGANRKWIATNGGVYLVNVDGTILLKHFTEENSPLLSNEVVAVTVDQSTGEVFFGTSKGTVSYMGDAIEGHDDASELYAFPNPVAWDFDGPVIIKGMRRFSKVKIANVAGQVVRELDSYGGQVPWDGNDAWGNKVAPGIYLVMVADPEGGGAGLVKIVLLERPQ